MYVGVFLLGVFKWNGQNWTLIGNITRAQIVSMAYSQYSNCLYVGGGSNPLSINSISSQIVKFDLNNSIWSNVGGGINSGNGITSIVTDVDTNNVVVGGYFQMVGSNNISANYIAIWNESSNSWSSFPGADQTISQYVKSLFYDKSSQKLFVNSIFAPTYPATYGSIPGSLVTFWDGSWSTFTVPLVFQAQITSITYDPNNKIVYVGGTFYQAGNNFGTTNIAGWDGQNWIALENGIGAPPNCIAFNTVDNYLYVGGSFSKVPPT